MLLRARLLNEAMYTTKEPLLAAAGETRFSSKGEKPVPDAKSDHEMKFYYDDEGHVPDSSVEVDSASEAEVNLRLRS